MPSLGTDCLSSSETSNPQLLPDPILTQTWLFSEGTSFIALRQCLCLSCSQGAWGVFLTLLVCYWLSWSPPKHSPSRLLSTSLVFLLPCSWALLPTTFSCCSQLQPLGYSLSCLAYFSTLLMLNSYTNSCNNAGCFQSLGGQWMPWTVCSSGSSCSY